MTYTLEELHMMMKKNSGSLYLNGTNIIDESNELRKVHYLDDGDYEPGRYVYADKILTHVKKKRQIHGYTLYVGRIPGHNVVYDGEYYAHCKTLREGIADMLYKRAAERGAEQYKSLTPDSELTFDEAVTAYRVITSACRQGTQQFVDSLSERKERYTVREMLELTRGQYGAERFAEFIEG